jgi:WD40 repeat protein
VRVYRNPCVKGRFRRFKVHGGNVLNLCWSDDDKYLASVGGIDRCMVVWEVETL